jgi:glycosyltransferase involved in cell wall biosynthesis
LKILLVQESDWLLRGPHQQHHLMEKLSLKGHIIHVIDYPITWRAEKKRGLYSKKEIFENVSRFYPGSKITVIRPAIIKLPVLDKISILFTHRSEIKKQMKEFKPDVVVGFGILNNYYAIKEAKKLNIIFLYYIIDTLHRLIDNKIYRIIAKEIEKNNMKNSDYILTINKQLKNYAIEMGGNKDNISVVPAGIDLSLFQNENFEATSIKRKYKINNDDFIMFFMGWLYNFSGILEVAEKLVKENYPGIKMMVVGDGDIYPLLINLIKKSNSDKIILTGKRPYSEIPYLLSIADVCVLPTKANMVMQDIVPIKIYEYMASGKPIISTKLKGLITEFGYDSGISYSDSLNEFFKMIFKFKENNGFKISEGKKAKNSVKNSDWSNIVDSFENILKRMVYDYEFDRDPDSACQLNCALT